MAEGIKKKTKSKISIATTGISGPSGKTKNKSVGLVYIALALDNKTIIKKFNFVHERNIHREITSSVALNMIRNTIK